MTYDFCILGSGIAGTWLSYFLHKAGMRVVMIHDPAAPAASTVAAGLMQRVTGRYLSCNPFVNALFDESVRAYKELEMQLGKRIIRPLKVYRSLNGESLERFSKAEHQDPFRSLLKRTAAPVHLQASSGDQTWVDVQQSQLVDPDLFFAAMHAYLKDQGCLIDQKICPEDLHYEDTQFSYGKIQATHTILCLGAKTPAFLASDQLDLRMIHGETLLAYTDKAQHDYATQAQHWVVPYHQGFVKCGATYDREPGLLPTQPGFEELSKALIQLGYEQFKPIMLQRGTRCQFANFQPQLTMLNPRMGVFVGLGSKGFITAPAMAKNWVDQRGWN